jgi:BirA family biotin operon repressor/biotin-[acetyl-CoA-carboxylase] ligase
MDELHRPLDPETIRHGIRGEIGSKLLYRAETGSTNADMLALAEHELRHGTIILTDHQSAGRGRLRRIWVAPPCTSLLLSVALDWPADLPVAQSIMLAALSVQDAIRCEAQLFTQLKWPNDVLFEEGKLCGILGETTRGRHGPMVVLGIGLNVNFDPALVPGIPASATSLQYAAGRPLAREQLFLGLVDALEMWYGGLTGSPGAVYSTWASRLEVSGRRVSVHDSTGKWDGTAISAEPDGGLRIRVAGGQERLVYAADVSLRGGTKDFTTG